MRLIIALDARTGKLVWETVVADSKQGYGYTSGPIVLRGGGPLLSRPHLPAESDRPSQ